MLAMVLRSERELLVQSKEQEDEIATLGLLLGQKDMEVERLKDLCLRQREEIRALKDVVLFPDQQPELHLGDEISSLTGHIQCLTQEFAHRLGPRNTQRGYASMNTRAPQGPWCLIRDCLLSGV